MRGIVLLAGLAVLSESGSAQNGMELAERLNREIPIERSDDVSRAQIERHMGKLVIPAKLNGEADRFIFDTGSPTMISKQLADQLQLQVIGSNIGRDANGKEVRTDIAVVEVLEIAGTRFRDVPVMIFDFTTIDPHGCFFEGGVIGSEIFPGSVWRLSTESLTLEIAATIEALGDNARDSNEVSIPLSNFGYPHAPIFDYRIGDLSDKGLFDTGNSATFVLFNRAVEDVSVRRRIRSDSIVQGRGSEGVSAAGLGDVSDLLRFELQSVEFGSADIGPLQGIVRSVPPTLMGLGMLAKYNVTLDYPGSRLLLTGREVEEPIEPYPGFSLMVVGGDVRVMQIFSDTAAQAAGLKLGDKVVAVDETPISGADEPCALQRWLIETRPAAMARSLTVKRHSERILIKLEED